MFKPGKNPKNNNYAIDDYYPIHENALRILVIILIVAATGFLVINFLDGQIQVVFLTLFFITLMIVSFLLLQVGNTTVPKIMLPTTLFITCFIAIISGFGLHDVGMFAFAAVISLASLTLGKRGTIAYSALVIISVLGIGIAESREILVSETSGFTTRNSIIYAIILVFSYAAIQWIFTSLLSKEANTAQQQEKVQFDAKQELKDAQLTLENQINEGTRQLQKNADQLAAISDVVHSAVSIQDIDELLKISVNLISKKFNYDQVAISLLDESGNRITHIVENYVDKQQNLERGFTQSIDMKSIVGRVIKNQSTYSTQYVQSDTQPEIAVPIKVRKRLIGVLAIKGHLLDSFSQEDVMILGTLGDILAVAIENTRLIATTRNTLIESVQSFQHSVQQAWSQYSQQLDQNEYRYQNGEIIIGKRKEAIQRNNESTLGHLSIPLFVRGQKIAALDIEPRQNQRKWTKDEIALVEAAAERTALALENARLLDDSQRRAYREQAIGEMSTKITATTDTETILQTAVLELGRQIGNAKVSIEINPESEQEKS